MTFRSMQMRKQSLKFVIAAALAMQTLSTSAIYAANGNTVTGSGAFANNVDGFDNSAFGQYALRDNTSGAMNSAVGSWALRYNTDGDYNVAVGYTAMQLNTTGAANTAVGTSALNANTTGSLNAAFGDLALSENTTGYRNVAIGPNGMNSNKSGSYNAAVGGSALSANTTGNFNVALGDQAGYYITGSNNVDIANVGVGTDDGVIRIGTKGVQKKAFIAGISGVNVANGVAVVVDANGKLGISASSERFKKDIATIESISDKLQQLRPVSFVYKDDEKNSLQYGLIAEEVAKVYPELVQYDADDKPFTVYYQLLTPLLIAQVQKDHAVLEWQHVEIAKLSEQLLKQQDKLAAMESLQQKVTALDEALKIVAGTPPSAEKLVVRR